MNKMGETATETEEGRGAAWAGRRRAAPFYGVMRARWGAVLTWRRGRRWRRGAAPGAGRAGGGGLGRRSRRKRDVNGQNGSFRS